MSSFDRNLVKASGNARSGFSLIEVCIALLLVGSGILLLFGLFPAGLKEAEYSLGDTQAALFADRLLSGFHANAATITEWDDWNDMAVFRDILLNTDATDLSSPPVVTPAGKAMDVATVLEYPAGSGKELRYTLYIDAITNHPSLRYAELRVSYGSQGWLPTWFRTEFFYSGMK